MYDYPSHAPNDNNLLYPIRTIFDSQSIYNYLICLHCQLRLQQEQYKLVLLSSSVHSARQVQQNVIIIDTREYRF